MAEGLMGKLACADNPQLRTDATWLMFTRSELLPEERISPLRPFYELGKWHPPGSTIRSYSSDRRCTMHAYSTSRPSAPMLPLRAWSLNPER